MYNTLFAIFTAVTILGLSVTCYARPKVCEQYKVYTADDGEKAAVCFDTKRPRLIQGAWTIVTLNGDKGGRSPTKVLVEVSK